MQIDKNTYSTRDECEIGDTVLDSGEYPPGSKALVSVSFLRLVKGEYDWSVNRLVRCPRRKVEYKLASKIVPYSVQEWIKFTITANVDIIMDRIFGSVQSRSVVCVTPLSSHTNHSIQRYSGWINVFKEQIIANYSWSI